MKLIKKLCPADKYPIKCPYTRSPDRIVVHNTANDAPAENEISYMLSRPEEVSFHFAVDDEKAVQGLPLDRNAWASGDGCGPGNMNGIHIEICYSLSGGQRFLKAEENGAELVAVLLTEHGWDLSRVTKHQDYDKKYCPHRTLDLGWSRFLKLVESKLNAKKEDDSYQRFLEHMRRYEADQRAKPASGWAEKNWEQAVRQGLFDGTAPRSPLTREQAAAVAARVLQLKG